MKQVFKLDHHTITYHGNGVYTLKADEGYVLKNTMGSTGDEVTTNDYTKWDAVEAPKEVSKPERKKRAKSRK